MSDVAKDAATPQPELMIACRHDVPDIIPLVKARLPEMSLLLSEDGWRDHYRFGAGQHSRDNYLPVVRLGREGSLVAFAWVDAAPAHDYGIAEPWWCINAVAVDERVAGHGLGTSLVQNIVDLARFRGQVQPVDATPGF